MVIVFAIGKIILNGAVSIKKIVFVSLGLICIFLGYKLLMRTDLFDRMLNSDSYKNNIRLIIWKDALNAFWMNPFLGNGLQSGAVFSKSMTGFVTHNCFLDILTGQGIVGLLVYVFMFFKLLMVK